MSQNTLTPEQVKAQAEAQGRKLGFLLASLKISKDTLEAILSILPALSLEQLERFSAVLKKNYLNVLTGDIDARIKRDLENIRADYRAREQTAEKKALEELDKVEENIKG